MTTTRRPRSRPIKPEISAAAIAAFRKMQQLDLQCTCAPDWDGAYWEHQECRACEQWFRQHRILWGELSLQPWQWPAIETPGAVSPYPEGSDAALNDKPDLEAQERYCMLERAAAEAERS